MPEDKTQAVTFGDDKSITTDVNGTVTRFVRSTDMAIVAGKLDTATKEWSVKETEFQTNLAESNRLLGEEKQGRIKAEAANEQVVKQYSDYDTIKGRVTELDKDVVTHKERVTVLETEISGRIRASLIAHGVKEEDIKDKTKEQLSGLEDAAKLFGGFKAGAANYDGNGGGGGNATDRDKMSGRQLIQLGLEQRSKK